MLPLISRMIFAWFFAEQISHVALLTSAIRGVFRGLRSYFVRALGYRAGMSEPANLMPAAPEDVATQSPLLAHGLGGITAEIVAERLVEHLERSGFVIMKRPPRHGRRNAGGIVAEGAAPTTALLDHVFVQDFHPDPRPRRRPGSGLVTRSIVRPASHP